MHAPDPNAARSAPPTDTASPRGALRHEAHQEVLGRPVWVLEASRPHQRRALRAEAELMARLAHPNILPVHAIVEEEDRLRVLLASVPGDTWERRLSQPHRIRAAFGAEDVLGWHVHVLSRLCSAVQHAHVQGILHGDLRPETVWIGDLGEIYLGDWSSARPLEAPAEATDLASLPEGALAYVPPERVHPAEAAPDVRSDVYQLGGLLYRILAGHGPHGEDLRLDTVQRVLFKDPGFPASAPHSLARVCKRALMRNPEARFASVADFHQALMEAFAQRGAWDIAAEADAQLDVLQRLLEEPEPDPGAIYRAYGAARLGFEHAILEAPGLASAPLRLVRSVELMVQHLLSKGDLAAAEAVLRHLDQPPPHLFEELQQARAASDASEPLDRATALGRDLDPHRDAGRRTWISTVLALLWVPSPLFALVLDPLWIAPAILVGAAVLTGFGMVLARLSAADRAESRLTRDLVNWTLWGAITIGFLVAIGALANLPGHALLAVSSVGTLLVTGAAALSLDRRLAIPALCYGAVAVLTIAEPWSWAIATFVANGVLTAALLTDARRPDAAG